MRQFNDEYDYLIHLVRSAVRDEQPQELPDHLSFEKVYDCALAHDIANLSFYGIEKLQTQPNDRLRAEWEMRRDLAITRDINQSFAADEIRDAFQAANIQWIEVQGTRIKPLYPRPEYRTMSDLDFIIDHKQLAKANELLTELGYDSKFVHSLEVGAFRSPNINIEVHSEFFRSDCEYLACMDAPFAHLTECGNSPPNATDEVFYLYSFLHIAKHYFGGGCGIRRVLDVYYLNKAYADRLDRSYIDPKFEQGGVTEFVDTISALAEDWFGDRTAPEGRDLSDMAAYIKASGLHGTLTHLVTHALEKEQSNGHSFPKFRYIWQRVIGNRIAMHTHYPILKKLPFLLPFCAIHRIVKALVQGKAGKILKEIKAIKRWKAKNK